MTDLIKRLRAGTTEDVGDDNDLMDEAADALEAMRWQSIETAPKDGAKVLLYGIWAWDGMEHCYEDAEPMALVGYWEDYDRPDFGLGHWHTETNNPYYDKGRVTHWMTLPKAPNQ